MRVWWTKVRQLSSMSDVKGLAGFRWHPSLLTVTHISLLGWLHSLCKALFGNYPMALTSPTSIQASLSQLHVMDCWGLHSDFPATPLASEVVLHRGGVYNPFTVAPSRTQTRNHFADDGLASPLRWSHFESHLHKF